MGTHADLKKIAKINPLATSITIPNSVTSIEEYAFEGCSALNNMYYLGNINEWVQIGFGYERANPLAYAKNSYVNGELLTNANITTATSISASAFEWCNSLTSVIIGDSVTSIGEAAF